MKRFLFALILFCTADWAAAHPAPFSFLDLYLDSNGIRGSWVIHDFDAAHELRLERPEMLLDAAFAAGKREALTHLINSRTRIEADKTRLEPAWGEIEVQPDQQTLRLRFELGKTVPGRIYINAQLFPYDPTHQTFINIYEDGKLKHQAILDANRVSLTYYAGSLQGRRAVVSNFVRAGIHHIMIGPDHILFLVGLLLLGGSIWRLASIVTAFTIGHSITLSLAALDIVSIAPSIIEPTIALSIVVVGVDNLLVRNQPARPEADHHKAPDLRPWLAAVFGLVHGFGFASVLQQFGLPREALGWSLAAFNVGVELGQLAIVLLVMGLLLLLRKQSAVLAERAVLFGSIGVIAAGTYWFVQRIWFTV